MSQLDRRVRVPLAESGEELLKMKLLTPIGDVNNFVGLPGIEPVFQSREIRCCVIEAAITLSNERRLFLERRDVLEEYRQRAFALARDAFATQLVDDALQVRIVKLSPSVVELDAKPLCRSCRTGPATEQSSRAKSRDWFHRPFAASPAPGALLPTSQGYFPILY